MGIVDLNWRLGLGIKDGVGRFWLEIWLEDGGWRLIGNEELGLGIGCGLG